MILGDFLSVVLPARGFYCLMAMKPEGKPSHYWFRKVLGRHPEEPQLFVVGGDWESQFDGAVADAAVVDEAFATWRATVAQADAFLDGLPDEALDVEIDPGDRIATIRDVLQQVLKEYARHLGHLDLLRETIDGRTGE